MGSISPHLDMCSGPTTHSFSKKILGKKTDFLITPFADKYFVVVTQNGRMGTLIESNAARLEQDYDLFANVDDDGVANPVAGESAARSYVYETRVVWGNRHQAQKMSMIFARGLMEHIAVSSPKSLMLSINVKGEGRELFTALLDAVKENYKFGIPSASEVEVI